MCECARATSEIHFPLFLVLVFHEHFHCVALFPSSAVADCWQMQLLLAFEAHLLSTAVHQLCSGCSHTSEGENKSLLNVVSRKGLPFWSSHSCVFIRISFFWQLVNILSFLKGISKKHQLWTQARLYTAQGVSLADQKSTICNSWTSQRKNFELRLMALLTKTWKVLIKKN